MNKFEIEKDVPLPERKSDGRLKYPWPTMEVGDSFFVPNVKPMTIRNAARGWAIRNGAKSRKYKASEEKQGKVVGSRIWRLK